MFIYIINFIIWSINFVLFFMIQLIDYLKHYKTDGVENNFTKLIKYCTRHGNKFGTQLIDYANVDVDLLECYLDIAMPAMSTVHFKDMMSHSTLSNTVTIGEEAFAILVFENNFKRWVYQAKEQQEGASMEDVNVPDVLYQQKVKRRKDNRETAGRWTDEGMERLNFFIKSVKGYRSLEGGAARREGVESELKRRYEMEHNGQSELLRRRKRRLDRTRENEEVVTKRVVVENMFNLTPI
jgi:hypothetical protein